MSAEILRALGALIEAPQPGLQQAASVLDLGTLPSSATHSELFSMQLVPYGSVYLNSDGRIGGEARDRIVGFWRALGLESPDEPDHLAVVLASMAELLDAETAAVEEIDIQLARHRARAFLGEHLLSWLPMYLLRVEELAPPFYAGWADLAGRALFSEAERLGSPIVESLHHREAEPLPEPESCDLEKLLDLVLAPVRCGFILTRHDLSGASRGLGVAARIGERRFMLQSMIRQRSVEVLRWLADFVVTARKGYSLASGRYRETLSIPARQAERVQTILDTALGGIE